MCLDTKALRAVPAVDQHGATFTPRAGSATCLSATVAERCVSHPCLFSNPHVGLSMSLRCRAGIWPAIVSTALTSASFVAVLTSFRQPGAGWALRSLRARVTASERVVFVRPDEMPLRVAVPGPPLPLRQAHPRGPAKGKASTILGGVDLPLDTGVMQAAAATAATPLREPNQNLSPLMPWPLSPRLAFPRKRDVPWYSDRLRRNPFGRAESLGTIEQDSILSALGNEVPELAVRRGQTRSERDAGAKEATLKMRLSGRILLVPPDNSGGLITSSVPLTLFGVNAARTRRASDNQAMDENRMRLARLRQRADSLRRSMVDSLP